MPNALHWRWERLTDASRKLFAHGDDAEGADAQRTRHDQGAAGEQPDGPLQLAANLEEVARTKQAQGDVPGAEALFRSALLLRDDTVGHADAGVVPTLDALAGICAA